ncbi:hypothetical protein [Mesorhizobium neociceri]|uniref:Uncharacterized protein n=1 Tax=Mesorhizobium neociceri TaxID=1307853 RepID=A0A838AZZ9_9HYPH|nr:hypothetical protein [Mesorhizobium neociceri]MBA1138840.1 hypothetical protein [Mesorhizobium neociceri]
MPLTSNPKQSLPMEHDGNPVIIDLFLTQAASTFRVARWLRERSQSQSPRHATIEFWRPTKCKERVDPIGFFMLQGQKMPDLKWFVPRDLGSASSGRHNSLIYL